MNGSMRNPFLKLATSLTAAVLCSLTPGLSAQGNPHVTIDTSLGRIVVELYPDKAPKTVQNFLRYVRSGHYDGVLFHRIIEGHIVQAGLGPDLKPRQRMRPIVNEADNGLKNERGTIAMARTPEPHSAADEFFINLKNNALLDHREKTRKGWGYAVFGKVISGLQVADSIGSVPTVVKGQHRNVPMLPVTIKKAWIH